MKAKLIIENKKIEVEISEEEYNSFGSAKLDEIADTLYKQGCNSERFLFSEKKEENNQKQLELLSKF